MNASRRRRQLLPIVGIALTSLVGITPSLTAQAAPSVSLRDAVRNGLDHHPAVSVARAGHGGAEALLGEVGAARFPSLVVDASMIRFQEPMVVAPLHRFDLTSPPLFDRDLLQSNLNLGYTLFDGGARGARIRRAEAGAEAAWQGVRDAEMEVVSSVTLSYLSVLTSREVLDASDRQAAALQSERDRVLLMLEEGRAARVDLLRVQAALSRAEAGRVSARVRLDVAVQELRRLTGLGASDLQSGSPLPLRLGRARVPDRTEALTRAKGGSPPLEAARRGVLAAEAGRSEAKASRLPNLQLGARYAEYGTIEGDFTWEWQATFQLSYPLFTGGGRTNVIRRAEAEERRAIEALRLTELQMESGIDRALAVVQEAGALKEALAAAAEQSEEVARIEHLALEAGAGVQTDYLTAEAELFRARAALSQARHGEIAAAVQLARAMGDLSVTWLEQNVEIVR